MKEYKHKFEFEAKLVAIDSQKQEKILSFASKNSNLSKLLPKDVNLTDNIGFQLFESEAFLVNKLNLNSDGVKTEEGIKLKNSAPLGFIDLEHERKNLVGVIVDSVFTDCKTGKELTEDEVKGMIEPFSVSITGIVWRAPNPELADSIENINASDSEFKNKIFCSWEVCFDNFDLIVMDKDKYDFTEGKLITDKAEVDELSKKLQCYGGNGLTKDGKKIGRVPTGDVVCLGVGLVEHPAGQLDPIVVASKLSTELSEAMISKLKSLPESGMGYQICDIEMNDGSIIANISVHNCSILSKELNISDIKDIKLSPVLGEITNDLSELEKSLQDSTLKIVGNFKNNENKISQAENLVVNDNSNIIISKMKIEKFEQITDENIKELNKAALTEIFAASTKDLVDSKIKEISLDYTNKLSEKDKAIEASNKAQAELNKSIEELNQKMSKASEDLQKVLAENAQREQVEAFSSRMESIENEFDLDDKQKEIVANKVKTLATDADFTNYLAEIEVLLAAKKKAKKTPAAVKEDAKDDGKDDDQEDKNGKKIAKASLNEDGTVVADTLKNGEKDKTVIANTSTVAESLLERSKKAFGIEGWNVVNKRKNRS